VEPFESLLKLLVDFFELLPESPPELLIGSIEMSDTVVSPFEPLSEPLMSVFEPLLELIVDSFEPLSEPSAKFSGLPPDLMVVLFEPLPDLIVDSFEPLPEPSTGAFEPPLESPVGFFDSMPVLMAGFFETLPGTMVGFFDWPPGLMAGPFESTFFMLRPLPGVGFLDDDPLPMSFDKAGLRFEPDPPGSAPAGVFLTSPASGTFDFLSRRVSADFLRFSSSALTASARSSSPLVVIATW